MKEIIDRKFQLLEQYVKFQYFPFLFPNLEKDNLCQLDSFRTSSLEHKGYEDLLIDCLISIFREVSNFMSPEKGTVKHFEAENSSGAIFSNKFYNDYLLEYHDNIFLQNIIIPFVFQLFGEDVVFLKRPLVRLTDNITAKDVHFYDHFVKNKKSESMSVVIMKKNTVYYLNYCLEEDTKYIKDTLQKNNIKYLYFEEYADKVLGKQETLYLSRKIDEFNKFVKELETKDGFDKMIHDEWDDVVGMLDQDMANFCQDETFKEDGLFSNKGFRRYLKDLSPNDRYQESGFLLFFQVKVYL